MKTTLIYNPCHHCNGTGFRVGPLDGQYPHPPGPATQSLKLACEHCLGTRKGSLSEIREEHDDARNEAPFPYLGRS